MPSLDLRQPQQFLFCKVEFYLHRHCTSRAHLLRLAKLYHAKPLDSILRMEYSIVITCANFQFVDLSSSRNIFVLGLSLYIGLVIPGWAVKNAVSIFLVIYLFSINFLTSCQERCKHISCYLFIYRFCISFLTAC